MQCLQQLQYDVIRPDLRQLHQRLLLKEKHLASHLQRRWRLLSFVVRPVKIKLQLKRITSTNKLRDWYDLFDEEPSSFSFLLCNLFQLDGLRKFFAESQVSLQKKIRSLECQHVERLKKSENTIEMSSKIKPNWPARSVRASLTFCETNSRWVINSPASNWACIYN